MKSSRTVGAILIVIALFKIMLALFILGNVLSGMFLLLVTNFSLIDLIIGILVLLVGLYLIRKD